MNSFILKIIACMCMFFDHFGSAFFENITILNYIGRFSFTIFCFQIVQGYLHTHDIKKYIKRLALFAIISQIPFMLFYHVAFDSFAINVIFTLLFGLLAILIYDKYNKFVGVCSFLLLAIIAQICHFDYGFFGVFIIFMFYLLRNKKIVMSIIFALAVITKFYMSIIKYGIPFSYLFMGNTYSLLMYFTLFSIIPIFLYNGKKGKDAKYLFYIFYPVHLLIFSLLKNFFYYLPCFHIPSP